MRGKKATMRGRSMCVFVCENVSSRVGESNATNYNGYKCCTATNIFNIGSYFYRHSTQLSQDPNQNLLIKNNYSIEPRLEPEPSY